MTEPLYTYVRGTGWVLETEKRPRTYEQYVEYGRPSHLICRRCNVELGLHAADFGGDTITCGSGGYFD